MQENISMQSTRRKVNRLLSAAFYLKNNLSQVGMGEFLDILNVSSGFDEDRELRTPFLFFFKYGILKNELTRIFPCTVCSKKLTNGANGFPTENQPCGHKYFEETSDKCYTILLPIEDQVKFFVKHHGIKKNNIDVDQSNMKGDVYTGNRYNKYVEEKPINEHTITIQLNIDGAQKFKSSKYGFWPFMGIVNETSYKTRRSNVILLAIWFGNKKPPASVFLDPCVELLDKIFSIGIDCNGEKYLIKPVIVTVDSVARPVLRNTLQFNGKFGCDFCLHPGMFPNLLLLKCY